MKRNVMALVIGGFVSLMPILSGIAVAQPTDGLPTSPAELTSAQRGRLQQWRSQLDAIVTPAQREQFKAAMQQGTGFQQAVAAMNLTEQQKTQLEQLRQQAGLPKPAQLNLTEEQKTQLQQFRQETRRQMEAIVAPAQREQFQAAMKSGKPFPAAIAAANLSQDQKDQLKQLMQSRRVQLESILSPEQRNQVKAGIRAFLNR